MTPDRFVVTPVHGETMSVFHVVDTHQPERDQPAVIRTYHGPEPARVDCAVLNKHFTTWPTRT